LVALADSPAALPGLLASDPALELFLLRFAQPAAEPAVGGFAPGALLSSQLPDLASAYLAATTAGVLPNTSLALQHVRRVAAQASPLAACLADATHRAPADAAATAARLAPLGWYAMAAVDSGTTAEPLCDPDFAKRPLAIQKEVWGLEQPAIARRLAARWKLPEWLAGVIGSLSYPLATALRLVRHPDLFAVVQLAVLEAERRCHHLGLTAGADRKELLARLQLDDSNLQQCWEKASAVPGNGSTDAFDPNPHHAPLIRNLLRMAAESRRRNGPSLVVKLEERIDRLHAAIADLGGEMADRLQKAKLDGLAELAAGAGHEINNPLAVISGNAQRLLRTEADLERGDSLRAIIRQSHRIAGIIKDLMQFARPPRPNTRVFALADLVNGAREEVSAIAVERGVSLETKGVAAGIWIDGDLAQLRQALAAVIRNGIEAAPSSGWVNVSCDAAAEGAVTILVEDSGPGLNEQAVEHAFDPFYCGRSAGRGRGLGLSTAWQLARQNGGELRYAPAEGEPTRFALTLQRAVEREFLSLRSA
jgi:signal transduction histidine kinase